MLSYLQTCIYTCVYIILIMCTHLLHMYLTCTHIYTNFLYTGIPMLSPNGRFAVQASLDLYSAILDVIERNEYDNFRKRAYTTKLEKVSILPKSYLAILKATSS